ncbi:MAG: FtsQ-type POTRA domain-containing protein [Sphingomonas fennica]
MSAAAASPRIRRGRSAPPPPARAARPAARRAGPGFAARLAALLPVRIEALRRAGNWLLAILVFAGIVAGLVAMGLPQMVGEMVGQQIGRMGYAVRTVEVVGRARADRDAVYRIALMQQAKPMPLVDLDGTRAALLRLGWVEDARVSRRLPDTLVVDIVEKKPAAVWQHRQQLALIDRAGGLIAAVDPATMPPGLPLVIGPDANAHAAGFAALIDSQPALKPMVEGGTWIGGRRWDIRFQSGETLALPEGDTAALTAYAYFAKRDAAVRLLGQGYVRFDMRDPQRIVVRVSREPGRRVAEPVAARTI